MNNLAVLVLLATLLVLPLSAAADESTYGAPLGEAEEVSLAKLIHDPAPWVGKKVRVEGRITDVCPRMGCWVDIADADSNSIRFKVKDGEIVFPVEVKDRAIVAEGVLVRLEMTREEAIAWKQHLAEEKGETFDPATVEGPEVSYRIDGAGARVR